MKETGLTSTRAVFDLHDPDDAAEIAWLFGDPARWEIATPS